MTSSTSQWNPEDVLGIGQISSGIICVGYAHSKQRRCNEPISAVKREQATRILLQIGRQDISSPRIEESLSLLAPLLSCKRKQHQDQISTVIEEWCDRIEELRFKEAAEREGDAEFELGNGIGPTTLQQVLAMLEGARRSGLLQLFGNMLLEFVQSR